MPRVHDVDDIGRHGTGDINASHFHSTHEAVYVSYLDPEDGQLRLRVYLVEPGGVLKEWRYPTPPGKGGACACGYRDPDLAPSVHDIMHPGCRERSDA